MFFFFWPRRSYVKTVLNFADNEFEQKKKSFAENAPVERLFIIMIFLSVFENLGSVFITTI